MPARIFPFINWFKGYSLVGLKADLVAGFTVALVLIPQSMAYAQLAGLPAYYGLYAAFLPPLVASLFGSSRQLATGPVAVVSLMTAASLEPLAVAGSPAFVAYALLLAFLVGSIQFLLGALRLGVVVNFISHPVINGFSNAAALIIASSQLAKFFGVSVDKAELHLMTVVRVFQAAAHHLHLPSLLLGLLAFGIMLVMKRLKPHSPYVLAAVVVTTLISWLTGFETNQRSPLSQVKSPALAATVREFNRAMTEIHEFSHERTQTNARAARVEASLGPKSHQVYALRAKAATLGVQIDEAKALAGFARRDLRHMQLVRAKDKSGSWFFYEQGKAPPGQEQDGRYWRLKVGEKKLDPERLLLLGGGEVVGSIPSGLPGLSLPTLSWADMGGLLPYAAIIALLGFMESISVAKAMASRTGQRIDPDQELIGQGLGNLAGAFNSGYPVAGSFSRSAVNLQAGAKSGMSSLFTCLAVLVVLLFFTPLLYHLPMPVLAAVIMMAVVGLLNIKGFLHAWRAQWYDGLISLITFAATLIFAPHLDRGILIGVGLSLLVFLYQSMRPVLVSLAVAEDGSFHDAEHFKLKQCRYVAMIRFDGPLFFANASFLEERIRKKRAEMPELRHIIIVGEGISELDASGEEALSHIVDRLATAGVGISFAGLHWRVTDVMKRTHLYYKIGEDNFYAEPATALRTVHSAAHRNSKEFDACPLLKACKLDSEP